MAKRSPKLRDLTDEDVTFIKKAARSVLGIAEIYAECLPDIEQQLYVRLWLKQQSFRKMRGSWRTFREKVLQVELRFIVRQRLQPSARFTSPCFVESLNADCSFDSSDSISLLDCVTTDGLLADNSEKPEIYGLNLKIDMADFLQSLKPRLLDVCMLLQVVSVSDAAKKLKISKVSIYRLMRIIREKMIAAGLDEYFSPENVVSRPDF